MALDFEKIKSSFSSLLKEGNHPAGISEDMELLLNQFPYCQPLHIIQAIQHQNQPTFEAYISKAALYAPNRTVLFNLIHQKSFPHFQTNYENAFKPIEPTSETNEEKISIPDEIIEDAQIIEETSFVTVEMEYTDEVRFEESTTSKDEDQEKPFFDTLASSDYFTFNESKADPLTKSVPESEFDSNHVSKYDDDTMPYSFLWWLHKTRKEHADTYQPYASFKLDTTKKIEQSPERELNQQIIENIFHLQVPIKDTPKEGKERTIQFEIKRKEEEIIERFIKEEPQIRPPKPEKIDTENKARKSSEDNLDLVSETLAQIYIEQMLYHKAIETYRKLSLKFPEKSTYFASQIVELQKKIN